MTKRIIPHKGRGSATPRHRPRGRAVATLAAALVVPAGLLTPASASAAPAYDRTDPREAQRVDRVPTPTLDWADCSSFAAGAQCTTVALPLDYDQPRGATTSVAVLRIKASDQRNKIGTLFLNPGGPGGSGVEIAAAASYFLSPDVLARFDVVGFDPRGTNYSDNVRCWRTEDERAAALRGMDTAFPWTRAERTSYVAGAKAFGTACSTTGKPLSAHMSTAEVARDMDVLRRATGDQQLTYLGFSYGSYLGQVYANMFPDRVRAVAIDGVLDPIGWTGTAATRNIPQTARIRSGEGSAKALHEILVRCGTAGPASCGFATHGDPVANHAAIIERVKRTPVVFPGEDGESFTISYATLIALELGMLYSPEGSATISTMLSDVYALIQQPAPADTPAANRQAEARARLAGILSTGKTAADDTRRKNNAFPLGFPYNNSAEAFQSVLCTDGVNPSDANMWSAYTDANDAKAPGFGRVWTWASASCASRTWTAQDTDRYAGPFTRRTVNPVLVVGNYWDPATNYDGAVKAASLLPNSRLLSSDSWGHTAFGSSACATTAIERYLLTKDLPVKGTTCIGDAQPFSAAPSGPTAQADGDSHRAPIVPILPGTPRW